MQIVKVKSEVLDKALQSKDFPCLHMYLAGLGGYERTSDGCFVCKVVKGCDDKPVLEIRLSLEDYFFNEYHEYPQLWDFAEKILGKKTVDLKVVNIVSL